MPRSPHGRASIALVLAVVLGTAATAYAPLAEPAWVAWPVGLVTGSALLFGRVGGYVVLQIGALLILASYLATGFTFADSFGVALAHSLGGVAVIGALTGFGVRPFASMVTESDIGRFCFATFTGAAVAAATIGLWAGPFSDKDPRDLAAGIGLHHLATQLVLLPWFVRKRYHDALAEKVEQVAQWVSVLVAVVVVFAVTDVAVAFALLTLLAWGARRLSTSAILVQLFVVSAAASALSNAGRGPFVEDQRPFGSGGFGRLDHADSVLLQLFIVSCALVVVPLVMTVGVQLEAARAATIERDRAQRIIGSAESVAIIGGDLDAITYFSPGAERLLGYTADEAVGRRIRLMTDAEVVRLGGELGADGFEDICRRLLDLPGAHEMRLRRKDGVERTHLASLRTVSDGGHVEYVFISEDITARREELDAQRLAIQRLREIDVAKDTFVSGVSHELRTPLTTMIGFLELLEGGDLGTLNPRQHDALTRIAGSNQRLLDLVDDLLSFAKLGEGEVGVDRVRLDVRDVVRAACELVEPAGAARGQTTLTSMPPDPVVVLGDAALLERVVINLVGNAVKFTPEGGRIEVSVSVEDDDAVVVVSDTGIGIPADEIERLFSRFFRSRLAIDAAVRGSGLGLSIAKAAVEAHDGTIAVASVEGRGTTVTTRLPLAALPAAHDRVGVETR